MRDHGEQSKWWSISSPYYFKHVKISALAMIKMLNHAKRGDPIEVMGLMTGKIAKGRILINSRDVLRLGCICTTGWRDRNKSQCRCWCSRVYGELQRNVRKNRKIREYCGMVPFSSGLRMLALKNRYRHWTTPTTSPGPLLRNCSGSSVVNVSR